MLGGRVRLMPCGAAPFKYEVLQFFRAALGAVVLEVGAIKQESIRYIDIFLRIGNGRTSPCHLTQKDKSKDLLMYYIIL